MNIVINDRYTLTGTPAEMVALMILMDTAVEDAPAPDPAEQEPEPAPEQPAPAVTFKATTTPAVVETSAPEPTPKKKRKAPDTDWGKARALRNAGWSYANIARELHVSAQTVANHLGDTDDQ